MPDSPDHPARAASRRSMDAVMHRDREGWLALFHPDAIVEDPIGPSPLDPDGNGHRGLTEIARFYDTVIAPNSVSFEIVDSFAAGDEVANVGTITTTLPDGSRVHTDGVFTYRVGDDGLLRSLRAFWEIDRLRVEPGS